MTAQSPPAEQYRPYRPTRDYPHPACRVTHRAGITLGVATSLGVLWRAGGVAAHAVGALIIVTIVVGLVYKRRDNARIDACDCGEHRPPMVSTPWARVAMLMDLVAIGGICWILYGVLFQAVVVVAIGSGVFWHRAAVVLPTVVFWVVTHHLAVHQAEPARTVTPA